MHTSRNEWRFGDKAKLAQMVGTSRQKITDYTKRRANAPFPRARALVEAAKELGYLTTSDDWQDTANSSNPLFNQ